MQLETLIEKCASLDIDVTVASDGGFNVLRGSDLRQAHVESIDDLLGMISAMEANEPVDTRLVWL